MASKLPILEESFLKNIGFMITYKCNICCPHCIVEAGPHRKEAMNPNEALNWLQQIRQYRNGYVFAIALTGGEAFYDLALLEKIEGEAAKLGLVVSAVTNGYWASTLQAAEDILVRFPNIQVLSFSTDPYHLKAVPFQSIKNAITAAKKLDRLYAIAICTDHLESPEYKKLLSTLKEMGEENNITTAITIPVGRAQKYASHLQFEYVKMPCEGCCSMANFPVIFPDGTVLACNGGAIAIQPPHPLYLGNLRNEKLVDILDRAEVNPFVHILRLWGPHKLAQLLVDHGQGDLVSTEYIKGSQCDACFKLLSDQKSVEVLDKVLHEKEMLELIAYGRLRYFQEDTMVQRLGLG